MKAFFLFVIILFILIKEKIDVGHYRDLKGKKKGNFRLVKIEMEAVGAQFNALCPSFASKYFCQEKQLFKEKLLFYLVKLKTTCLKLVSGYMIFSGEHSTPVPLKAELFCYQRNKIFKRACW